MSAQAYHSLSGFLLCAGVFVVMVRLRDHKYNALPCALCGRRGKHALDCPGNR
jgi:hypothetical protein